MARKTILKGPFGFRLKKIQSRGYEYYSLTTSKKKWGKKRVYSTRRIGGLREL